MSKQPPILKTSVFLFGFCGFPIGAMSDSNNEQGFSPWPNNPAPIWGQAPWGGAQMPPPGGWNPWNMPPPRPFYGQPQSQQQPQQQEQPKRKQQRSSSQFKRSGGGGMGSGSNRGRNSSINYSYNYSQRGSNKRGTNPQHPSSRAMDDNASSSYSNNLGYPTAIPPSHGKMPAGRNVQTYSRPQRDNSNPSDYHMGYPGYMPPLPELDNKGMPKDIGFPGASPYSPYEKKPSNYPQANNWGTTANSSSSRDDAMTSDSQYNNQQQRFKMPGYASGFPANNAASGYRDPTSLKRFSAPSTSFGGNPQFDTNNKPNQGFGDANHMGFPGYLPAELPPPPMPFDNHPPSMTMSNSEMGMPQSQPQLKPFASPLPEFPALPPAED